MGVAKIRGWNQNKYLIPVGPEILNNPLCILVRFSQVHFPYATDRCLAQNSNAVAENKSTQGLLSSHALYVKNCHMQSRWNVWKNQIVLLAWRIFILFQAFCTVLLFHSWQMQLSVLLVLSLLKKNLSRCNYWLLVLQKVEIVTHCQLLSCCLLYTEHLWSDPELVYSQIFCVKSQSFAVLLFYCVFLLVIGYCSFGMLWSLE